MFLTLRAQGKPSRSVELAGKTSFALVTRDLANRTSLFWIALWLFAMATAFMVVALVLYDFLAYYGIGACCFTALLLIPAALFSFRPGLRYVALTGRRQFAAGGTDAALVLLANGKPQAAYFSSRLTVFSSAEEIVVFAAADLRPITAESLPSRKRGAAATVVQVEHKSWSGIDTDDLHDYARAARSYMERRVAMRLFGRRHG